MLFLFKEKVVESQSGILRLSVGSQVVYHKYPATRFVTQAGEHSIKRIAQQSEEEHQAVDVKMASVMHDMLSEVWVAPPGMPKKLECKVSFTVNSEGKVEKEEIVQRSGVMIYDASVQHALYALTMPSEFKGKTIEIAFKT